jgi:hypothetical protein
MQRSGPLSFPFPVEEPPRRRVVAGLLLSFSGAVIVAVGFVGGGLAANGILWSVVHLVFLANGRAADLPGHGNLLLLALLAIPLGILLAVYGLSEGVRLRDQGRRLRACDARTVLIRGKQEPVLLLRSFEDEQNPDPRPLDFWQRRYEESLVRVLRRLGPVVAIGRPGDNMSFGGAARLFVTDAYWRPAIQYLMKRSRAVAIVVGRTEGLWWEIETAFETVPREHLLFFFPYVHKTEIAHSRVTEAKVFIARWNLTRRAYQCMEEERTERYDNFRRRCAPLLDEQLPGALGKSMFLDFLPGGKVRLLRTRIRPVWQYFLPLTGANIMVDLFTARRHRRLRFDIRHTLAPFMAKMRSMRS